ncbi:hypothetical protein [Paramagnetospirillum magneticum]|nr:hypothetical protein [Paramagnetospirillum magneticum]
MDGIENSPVKGWRVVPKLPESGELDTAIVQVPLSAIRRGES